MKRRTYLKSIRMGRSDLQAFRAAESKRSAHSSVLSLVMVVDEGQMFAVRADHRVARSSVVRNRLKRIGRELFRRYRTEFPAGCRVVATLSTDQMALAESGFNQCLNELRSSWGSQ